MVTCKPPALEPPQVSFAAKGIGMIVFILIPQVHSTTKTEGEDETWIFPETQIQSQVAAKPPRRGSERHRFPLVVRTGRRGRSIEEGKLVAEIRGLAASVDRQTSVCILA